MALVRVLLSMKLVNVLIVLTPWRVHRRDDFPSLGQGAAGQEVPQPMDFSHFQEHLKNCEDTCYSKRKGKFIFSTCLHCFPTGDITG